eukprot:TRINITY_DN9824_c0_g1_i1.p1 TRINITY_DN9824_c0_g1~~TRINITY_DN9824_c0_g1_i1.p1  ORF type:complete len:137 (-),score=17.41 TRINITY_DN9824_c0_g1_i1:127-537(-)
MELQRFIVEQQYLIESLMGEIELLQTKMQELEKRLNTSPSTPVGSAIQKEVKAPSEMVQAYLRRLLFIDEEANSNLSSNHSNSRPSSPHLQPTRQDQEWNHDDLQSLHNYNQQLQQQMGGHVDNHYYFERDFHDAI